MNELREILSEGISHVVYHFTSLQALYRILMTQKFYLKTGVFRDSYEHKLSDGKRMYYLSTTRNKNANEGYSNGYKSESSVRITLDGEKLSHNYKGMPINYWGDDSALGRMKYLNPDKVGQPLKWDKDMQQHRNDETEDRIWSFHPTIPNVLDYIKRVDILLPNENVISDYENRIVKAQQDGKDALVKSFQNSVENRKEEERHLKSIVYEIYNLIDRRGILFLYDNENDFIMGNNHTVKPEWLSNNDFYKDYKERQSVYSQQFNYQTNNALFSILTSALAIMVYNERHENRKKRIIEYCKQYGFQNMLSQNLFTKVDSILYRNSNIFDISRDIDDNLRANDEDASRVKDMVTHWMRKNGYRNLRNVVGEGKDITKVRQGMIAYESNEPDYEIGFEKGDLCPYAHVVNEETNPEDVDLSSFEIQDKLNPKFWKNNKLDSRIRLKLLDIADDFVDSLNIKWVDPEDITMTGSLANYTWNEEHSDIDLHIIMDYKKVDDKTDFVKNYFDAKKKEWNNKHSEIKIFGFPIEVYVQDKNEPHKSSGVYSLEKNEWITEPNRKNFSESDYDDNTVKKTVSDYMNQIDDIEEKFNKVEDLHQTEDIYDEAEEVFDNIKDERKNAFKKSNKELSTGNVIFKTLRRNGYIEKISNLKDKSYNKINSLS